MIPIVSVSLALLFLSISLNVILIPNSNSKPTLNPKSSLLYFPLEKSAKTLRGARLCTNFAVQRKDVRLPILDTQPILSPPDVVSTAIALVVFINILLVTLLCACEQLQYYSPIFQYNNIDLIIAEALEMK